MNIILKWALSILKTVSFGKKQSLKLKRYVILNNPEKYLRMILEM